LDSGWLDWLALRGASFALPFINIRIEVPSNFSAFAFAVFHVSPLWRLLIIRGACHHVLSTMPLATVCVSWSFSPCEVKPCNNDNCQAYHNSKRYRIVINGNNHPSSLISRQYGQFKTLLSARMLLGIWASAWAVPSPATVLL